MKVPIQDDQAMVNGPLFPKTIQDWLRMGDRIIFSLGAIEFGQFRAEDTAAMYDIRNHSTVRTYMHSANELSFDKHVEWVRSNLLKIHNESPLILVGYSSSTPVGLGLLKPTAENDALEVGVIVTGEYQNNSTALRLGAAMFAIASQIFGARILVSNVNRQHAHALRLNKGAGLIETAISVKPGEIHFRTNMLELLSTAIYRRCIRGLEIRIVRKGSRNEVK